MIKSSDGSECRPLEETNVVLNLCSELDAQVLILNEIWKTPMELIENAHCLALHPDPGGRILG